MGSLSMTVTCEWPSPALVFLHFLCFTKPRVITQPWLCHPSQGLCGWQHQVPTRPKSWDCSQSLQNDCGAKLFTDHCWISHCGSDVRGCLGLNLIEDLAFAASYFLSAWIPEWSLKFGLNTDCMEGFGDFFKAWRIWSTFQTCPGRRGQGGQFFTSREMLGTELEDVKVGLSPLGNVATSSGICRFGGCCTWGVLGPGEPNSCPALPWALSPSLCAASELLHQSSHQGALDIGWCLSSTWRLNMLRCEQVFAFLVLSWDTEVMSVV